MAGDFNIRNSDWNSLYSFHSFHNNILLEIADYFDLILSLSI